MKGIYSILHNVSKISPPPPPLLSSPLFTLIHSFQFKKLMICLKCESDLQDVNALVSQFENMDLMHRVLKYRADNGKAIPTDEESAKSAMQSDLKKVLSDKEWKAFQRMRMKAMRNRR